MSGLSSRAVTSNLCPAFPQLLAPPQHQGGSLSYNICCVSLRECSVFFCTAQTTPDYASVCFGIEIKWFLLDYQSQLIYEGVIVFTVKYYVELS